MTQRIKSIIKYVNTFKEDKIAVLPPFTNSYREKCRTSKVVTSDYYARNSDEYFRIIFEHLDST